MRTHKIEISGAVRDVLARSTFVNGALILPEQLDRKLYVETDKILKTLGGKWKRGTGHVFASDPRPGLAVALDTGSVVDKKKTFQAFFTPAGAAKKLISAADIQAGDRVLEPSAGSGSLVQAVIDTGRDCFITAVEINPDHYNDLIKKVSSLYSGADFLTFSLRDLGMFDVVVMNPPFSGNQDAKHVLHAWSFVKEGGRLAAIVSPGFRFKQTGIQSDFRALHDEFAIHEEDLPSGTFSESGTEVATVLIVWKKG